MKPTKYIFVKIIATVISLSALSSANAGTWLPGVNLMSNPDHYIYQTTVRNYGGIRLRYHFSGYEGPGYYMGALLYNAKPGLLPACSYVKGGRPAWTNTNKAVIASSANIDGIQWRSCSDVDYDWTSMSNTSFVMTRYPNWAIGVDLEIFTPLIGPHGSYIAGPWLLEWTVF